MNVARARARGFTLIELMVVTAIVGLLATVAVPEFDNMVYRSRIAEREAIMRAVAQGVEDVTLNASAIPAVGNTFAGAANPVGVPGAARRHWTQAGLNGWKDLPLVVQGDTFCSYSFLLNLDPLTNMPVDLWVTGFCDVDADGVQNSRVQHYVAAGNALSPDCTISNTPTCALVTNPAAF